MWVATQDLPRSAAHPFYARLNQILDQHDFDPIAADAPGRRTQRPATPCTAIGGAFAAHEACAYCGSAASDSNGRLLISMRRAACGACISVVTRIS
jgi:hypothetical protein